MVRGPQFEKRCLSPLNAQLNPICHLLALLGAHLILHVSRIRVNGMVEELQQKLNIKKPNMRRRKQINNWQLIVVYGLNCKHGELVAQFWK